MGTCKERSTSVVTRSKVARTRRRRRQKAPHITHMCGSAHTLLPQAACGADLGFGCDALDSVAENGGLRQVVADNASDTEQIARIRSQLQDEAAKFQRGNFSDPAAIHGGAMPGLAELQQGYAQLDSSHQTLYNRQTLSFLILVESRCYC